MVIHVLNCHPELVNLIPDHLRNSLAVISIFLLSFSSSSWFINQRPRLFTMSNKTKQLESKFNSSYMLVSLHIFLLQLVA